jgi:hypothetical protein
LRTSATRRRANAGGYQLIRDEGSTHKISAGTTYRTPNRDHTITWTHIYILDNTTSRQRNTEKRVYDLLHDRIGEEQAQYWTANAKACDRDEDDYIYVLVGSVDGGTEHCIVQ